MVEDRNRLNFTLSLSGQLGKLGLKINGGRDRPCVPGDPGIFITAVKRGSVLNKVIGPGDKILKVFISNLCVYLVTRSNPTPWFV